MCPSEDETNAGRSFTLISYEVSERKMGNDFTRECLRVTDGS